MVVFVFAGGGFRSGKKFGASENCSSAMTCWGINMKCELCGTGEVSYRPINWRLRAFKSVFYEAKGKYFYGALSPRVAYAAVGVINHVL